MKKIQTLLWAALVACLMLTGCTESRDNISSRQITQKVNNQLKAAAETDHFTSIAVGTYEVDAFTRCQLKQLEAAGLITYSEQRFCWWEKRLVNKKTTRYVTRSSWFYTWQEPVTSYVKKTEYDNPDHVIATVALTAKGQKLTVESIPQPADNVDKDLQQPEYDPEDYPEGKADCAWNFPEIPNPWLKKEEPVEEEEPVVEEVAVVDSVVEELPAEEEEIEIPDDGVERIDKEVYQAYLKALAQAHSEEVIFRSYSIKATKARNIQLVEVGGIRIARAEVILEVKSATDAGRILDGMLKGMKTTTPVVLTYYLDRGWVLGEGEDL